jgi:hypothetical protein
MAALCFPSGLVHFEPCLRGGRTRSELIANIVIMFIGIVPAAASAVYKQSHLQDNVRRFALLALRSLSLRAALLVVLAGHEHPLDELCDLFVPNHSRTDARADRAGAAVC